MTAQAPDQNMDAAKANLDLVIGWTSHADSKATFYLTMALAILGASLTEIPTLVKVCVHCWGTQPAWIILLVGLHIVFYGFALFAAYMALEVVKPRIEPESNTQSWYFFQSISRFEDVEKWSEFSNGLSEANKFQQLTDQIWNVSRVAMNKYKKAGWADFGLRVAICSGVVAVVVTLVVKETMGA